MIIWWPDFAPCARSRFCIVWAVSDCVGHSQSRLCKTHWVRGPPLAAGCLLFRNILFMNPRSVSFSEKVSEGSGTQCVLPKNEFCSGCDQQCRAQVQLYKKPEQCPHGAKSCHLAVQLRIDNLI